jgi:hypothetical protein
MKLVTCDVLAGSRHEVAEHARRLILQGHAPAVASQLARREIQLEGAEPDELANSVRSDRTGGRPIPGDAVPLTVKAVHDWLR